MAKIDSAQEAAALRERLVSWRRDFHRHPELAWQERRSARIVAAELECMGYKIKTGVAETGVVALLEGDGPGPVVMVRFDMDALPIVEATQAEYGSQNPGVMHACGHDGHMAIGLGVATVMAQYRSDLTGTLKLVFQPAEEPGDGARMMVNEGVLENPSPHVVLIAHLWNEIPVGTIDVRSGPVMAAAERLACDVRGRGGHAALPHQAADPIVAASHMVTALQSVVSRNVNPLDTAVLTVGSFQGGNAFNVIPDSVHLEGTIRTFDAQVREEVRARVREVLEGIASACGVSADVEITALSPAVVNDPDVAETVRDAAETILGPERVSSGVRTMGSEDAALFTERIPGCYFFIGSANSERGLDAPHHSPHFDFDEDALPLGVAVMTESVLRYL